MNDRGIVAVMALLVMLLLTMMGMAFLTISATEHTIAANEVKMKRAFNIAEAGIERGKHAIKSTPLPLAAFLSGQPAADPGPWPFGDVAGLINTYDGGNYVVHIYDNEDDAPAPNNPLVDKDNKLYIDSVGTLGTARRRIIALVEKQTLGFPPLPGGYTAVTTTPPTWDLDQPLSTVSGVNPVTGKDWSGTCSGVAGIVHATPGMTVNNSGTLQGGSRTYNPATDDAMWNDPAAINSIVDAWKARPGTVSYTGNNPPSLGTAAAPQVTVWRTTGATHTSALTGYGVLILEGPSGWQFGPQPFNFHGLVIHMGGKTVEYTGPSLVRGGVISVNAAGATNGSVEDTASLKYDCQALSAYANQAVGGGNGSFKVHSWREVAE